MSLSIAIGSDHAGYDYKELIIEHLKSLADSVIMDVGTFNIESVDYPDYAHKLAIQVEDGVCDLGILLCGSGNGVAITANKHSGIRAALCWTSDIAALAKQHNDANICCIPARFVTVEEALAIVDAFIENKFEGGRHQLRVNKINC